MTILEQTTPAAFALAGIITGAILNHILSTRAETKRQEKHRTQQAQYIAIRIVCALDDFVHGCVAVVTENPYEGPSNSDPNITFPSDVDWKNLDPNLLYRVLNFPNQISRAQEHISYVATYESMPPDYDEVFDARQCVFAQLGLTAHSLSEDLRRIYKLPSLDNDLFDPSTIFMRAETRT